MNTNSLLEVGETVNITDFVEYHSIIDVTDTGNGYDNRIVELHDLCHPSASILSNWILSSSI